MLIFIDTEKGIMIIPFLQMSIRWLIRCNVLLPIHPLVKVAIIHPNIIPTHHLNTFRKVTCREHYRYLPTIISPKPDSSAVHPSSTPHWKPIGFNPSCTVFLHSQQRPKWNVRRDLSGPKWWSSPTAPPHLHPHPTCAGDCGKFDVSGLNRDSGFGRVTFGPGPSP